MSKKDSLIERLGGILASWPLWIITAGLTQKILISLLCRTVGTIVGILGSETWLYYKSKLLISHLLRILIFACLPLLMRELYLNVIL